MTIIKLSIIFYLIFQTQAFAYIDPGTGAFIIQTLIAVMGAIVFYLGYPIRLLKRFFKKKKTKNKTS